ncbi:hypothetical protein FGB62_14g240 [Gracilaria domingensis]|nr:hypothetical protein FGB62_14g240 [Gracilaria domingensis]
MPLFRSQYVGQVEILEDEQPAQDVDVPASRASEQKSAARTLLLHEANVGLQDTKTILSTAVQSHHIAEATASSLSAQTGQLEDIAEDLETVEGTVDKAGNTVYQLTRNPLRAFVEKPLTRRKRRQKRDKSALLSTKEKPDDTSSKSNESENESHSSWLARRKEELIPSSMKKGNHGAKQTLEPLEDDYSDFDDDVKLVLQKQDGYLDQTANQLTELQNLALGINTELDKQAEIVDSIDAPKITAKLRYNNAKLKRKFRL